MLEIIDSINDQMTDMRMKNIEPKYLIVNDLVYPELKATADIFKTSQNINKPMFMGLIIAVVSSDDNILEVR